MTGKNSSLSVTLAAMLVVATLTGAIVFTDTAAAAESATITADPSTENETSTHRVEIGVSDNEAGNSLSNVVVDYSTGDGYDGTIIEVDEEDVEAIGIDDDGDGEIDTNVTDLKDVHYGENATQVTFDFGGNYGVSAGDTVVVEYNDTVNPAAGNYTVAADINTGSSADPANATMNVTESDDTTAEDPASELDELIASAPDDPGVKATHWVNVKVSSNEAGNSLGGILVNYHEDGSYDGSVQDVDADDIERVGIDEDGDGRIETDVSGDLSDVSAKNVGETLTLDFGGSYSLEEGDSVILVFSDTDNPNDPGEYDVAVDLNEQSTNDPRIGSIELANFTTENATLEAINETAVTYNNTSVVNSTWRNVTLVNDTFENVTVANGTVWNNTTVTNATVNETTFENTTYENVTLNETVWENTTWVNDSVTNTTVNETVYENVSVVNTTWNATTWENTTVENTTWTNSTAENVTVDNSTLENVTVDNSTWENTTVDNSSYENVSTTNTTFENTSVTNSTWNGTTWDNSTAANVTVVNSTFENVTFQNATLENVTIANATWENTTVTNSTFSDSNTSETTWDNVTVEDSNVTDTTWVNATVDDANMTETTWENATVEATNVSDSAFTNVTVTNSTWSESNVTHADWTNSTLAATINDSVVANLTMEETTWNATSGLWNTSWEEGQFENTTFDGVTYHNSTGLDASYHNVSATEIEHHNITLETLTVESETLVTATLEDHKYKNEEKYVREVLDGNENKDR